MSSSEFVSNTREVYLLGLLSYVSQLKFYVVSGLSKPSILGRLGTAIVLSL